MKLVTPLITIKVGPKTQLTCSYSHQAMKLCMQTNVRCSFIMRRLSQDTVLSKKSKMRCRVKKVCSEFESNLCNMITTSSKEVTFMKIHCVLIYLNRIIVEDLE